MDLERFAIDSLLEGQKVAPALAFPDEESLTKPGAFKISSKVLKFFKDEVGHGPDMVLFKKTRQYVSDIPHNELPRYVGKKDMSDAQDFIAGKPRVAFNKWLELSAKVDPKLARYLREVPSNASLVFYLFMIRISGREMADIVLKRYFQTETDHIGAVKASLKQKGAPEAATESVMTLDGLEAAAGAVRAHARAGGVRGHDDTPRTSVGAPNIEASLRQQAMSAMGGRSLLAEGRQSTASLHESAPPDVLSWLMGRDLQNDVYKNNDHGYVPAAGVLGNRERGRQQTEIEAIGRKLFGYDFASEYNGITSLWVTHRSANRATGDHSQKMRELGKVLTKAGYKLKTTPVKGNSALIDSMVVLYDQQRIKDAERGHAKYLDAMRKHGAMKMNESADELLRRATVRPGLTEEDLLDGVRMAAEEEASGGIAYELSEAKNGKVETFITILSSHLTQYDQAETTREVKRGGRGNFYRLGHLLGAVGKVRDDLAKVADNEDEASLALLKASITKHFQDTYPPVKKLLKQIDVFLATGKKPSITVTKAVKDQIKAERAVAKAANKKLSVQQGDDLLSRLAVAEGFDPKKGSATNIKLMIRSELKGRDWFALTDLARGADFRGVHFKKILAAAEALVKEGLVQKKSNPQDGILLKLVSRSESLDEDKRASVKSVSASKSWNGYRVSLSDQDAKKLSGDKEVQSLLGRPFEFQSYATDAAQRMFPNAKVAL